MIVLGRSVGCERERDRKRDRKREIIFLPVINEKC